MAESVLTDVEFQTEESFAAEIIGPAEGPVSGFTGSEEEEDFGFFVPDPFGSPAADMADPSRPDATIEDRQGVAGFIILAAAIVTIMGFFARP